MRKSVGISVVLAALALFCMAGSLHAGSQADLKPTTLSWVAGGVGGGWYVQAGGIARLISEKEPKIVIKVVPGGGVVNPVRVARHKDDLGWGITFVDKMALNGTAPIYRAANKGVMGLGGVFGIYHIHFIAAKDKGISTVEEMAAMVKAGKSIKVAVPMKGTSDLPLIENMLAFYGIKLSDITAAGGKVFNAVYADMVTLYKDRHVDFVFTHLGLPGAAVTEMAVSRGVTLLSVSDACIDTLNKKLGTLSRESGYAKIPAGTYKGQDKDVPAVVSAGELLINKDVPENVAYTVIKTICENIDELYRISEANKFFKPETGWANAAVPLHPGAVRYYREAGYMK